MNLLSPTGFVLAACIGLSAWADDIASWIGNSRLQNAVEAFQDKHTWSAQPMLWTIVIALVYCISVAARSASRIERALDQRDQAVASFERIRQNPFRLAQAKVDEILAANREPLTAEQRQAFWQRSKKFVEALARPGETNILWGRLQERADRIAFPTEPEFDPTQRHWADWLRENLVNLRPDIPGSDVNPNYPALHDGL